jgi:hypothetical protein
METPQACVNYILSRQLLSDDDFENNQYGIGIHPKNTEEIEKLNVFLKTLNKTKKQINNITFFNRIDGDNGQIIIKPDLTIIVRFVNREYTVGKKYLYTEIERLMCVIFENEISFGTVNNMYRFKKVNN